MKRFSDCITWPIGTPATRHTKAKQQQTEKIERREEKKETYNINKLSAEFARKQNGTRMATGANAESKYRVQEQKIQHGKVCNYATGSDELRIAWVQVIKIKYIYRVHL